MKKKLWIPLMTAVCFMYGCSSASTVSTVPATEAETSAAADEAETASPETTEAADKSAADSTENTADSQPSSNADNAESSDDNSDKSGTDSTKEDDAQESSSGEDDSAESMGEIEEEHIETVKNACPENFPQCSYGKAFEEFFSSPEWKYFESTDGRDVVEFSGECMYAGARTKARLQLVVDMATSTVTPGAMYYNSTPQSTKVISSSLESIFKQYADRHGIRYAATQPLAPEQNTAANASADSSVNTSTASANAQAGSAADLSVKQGGLESALSFAAWNNPGKTSWYSPSTGYYMIPFIDNAGHASLAFTTALTGETPGSSYISEYYTDAVSAVLNEAGGLTYQGYLYRAGETPQMIGMIEAVWTSEASISGLTVNMINGSQAMDTSVASNDYTYSGTVK